MDKVVFPTGDDMMTYIQSRGQIKPNIKEQKKKSFSEYMDMTETKFIKDFEIFLAIGLFIGIMLFINKYNN